MMTASLFSQSGYFTCRVEAQFMPAKTNQTETIMPLAWNKLLQPCSVRTHPQTVMIMQQSASGETLSIKGNSQCNAVSAKRSSIFTNCTARLNNGELSLGFIFLNLSFLSSH